MADPTTFPEEHVGEPLVYRHISGFAIAALIVACGYALIVLVACASGLHKWVPVLLSPWIQSLAVVGAGLSLVALLHISRSEGTVAGTKLAVWSLLISVFFGLGYGAYYVATYFAIRQQADDFTKRWLRKLEDGKINHAFLDTQDPAVRQRINPEDEDAINARFAAGMSRMMAGKTPLEAFRENKIVHLVAQGGAATRVTPLGVSDWEYAGGGYRVARTYQIETAEGVFETQITAKGSESKAREYEGREWQILSGGTQIVREQPSELGREILGLEEQSNQFIEQWGDKLVSGRLEEAYLDTLEPTERSALAVDFARRRGAVHTLALGVSMVKPLAACLLLAWAESPDADELARQLLLPGYAARFSHQGILRTDKFRAPDVEAKDHILKAVKAMFSPVRTGDPRLLGLKPGFGSGYYTWTIDHERLRLPHDCRLAIGVGGRFKYSALATITVESDPGPLKADRKPAWRIISVELMNGEEPSRNQGMMGPRAS